MTLLPGAALAMYSFRSLVDLDLHAAYFQRYYHVPGNGEPSMIGTSTKSPSGLPSRPGTPFSARRCCRLALCKLFICFMPLSNYLTISESWILTDTTVCFLRTLIVWQRSSHLARHGENWRLLTEDKLHMKVGIQIAFGETLSWKYLCYAREHPITWNIPTNILYGKKDPLTSFSTISQFARQINGTLTVMKNGEHWFPAEEQLEFLFDWIRCFPAQLLDSPTAHRKTEDTIKKDTPFLGRPFSTPIVTNNAYFLTISFTII